MVTHDKCDTCIHETVCGFKSEYNSVCDAVKRSHCSAGAQYPTFVCDSPVPVTIQCPHIMPKTDKGDES